GAGRLGVPRHAGALGLAPLGHFGAAARRDDPVIIRRTTEGGGVPRSLRPFARCPDDLRGDGHDDALVLSGALWEAREALSNETLLRAIGHAAPLANDRVATFVGALERALGQTSAAAARRW
ncbi:MAG: hypothetical protein JNJ59_27970, partial [Deltaproteobacteria bacterium]|nr:hypothetical protein [Deltaproteobacteria bacterium]